MDKYGPKEKWNDANEFIVHFDVLRFRRRSMTLMFMTNDQLDILRGHGSILFIDATFGLVKDSKMMLVVAVVKHSDSRSGAAGPLEM